MIKKEWNILNKSPGTDIIKSTLAARGIKDMVHFLQPRESDLLPLTDLDEIEEAAEIIIKAINEKKRIHVFPDVDVDGVTSGCIIYQYLSFFTDNITWSINKGKVHGLSAQDLESYIDNIDLVIAVDSSSEDIEQQQFLKENGIKVVILDHHPAKHSKYATIVNCQMGDYKNRHLSGSAVVFKFVKYLDELLGTNYSDALWDLATVGLIGDTMEVGENNLENRYICSKGFNSLTNIALKQIIGNYTFNGTSVSYSIAPLINAAQRMNRNHLAFELIIENDKKKCNKIIDEIKELKIIQNIQKDKLVDDLTFTIKANELDKQKAICLLIDEVKNDDQGDIVGLTGNILSADYMMPVIIVHPIGDGEKLGGSIRGYGIKSFQDVVNSTKLVVFCKGHPNAAGIELYAKDWDKLIVAINKKLAKVKFKVEETADVVLKPEQITVDLIKKMEYINTISGKNFPPIKIVVEDIEIDDIVTMQKKHIKFSQGGIEFVKWNSYGELENFKSNTIGIYKTCDVLGTMVMNNFRGKVKKQMVIQDTRNFQDNLEFMRE
ncbi:DHH family phosphoesterase [Clostridium sp. FP2]|uniref:DHH family phosphoesterase n=1 Tax=Clostridium sp. FP2 TaxID=2724481 RepID=UPI0013E99922|nr:DHH family phosphoesterase [Clostridium sp. FP2]MBZ9622959.1 DHH family phosphoesterase [Clostridium sp. FP2]